MGPSYISSDSFLSTALVELGTSNIHAISVTSQLNMDYKQLQWDRRCSEILKKIEQVTLSHGPKQQNSDDT